MLFGIAAPKETAGPNLFVLILGPRAQIKNFEFILERFSTDCVSLPIAIAESKQS
jgi:hypothetical protein